jgi:adenylate cyclase
MAAIDVMTSPWTLERLAAAAAEVDDRIQQYADAGLLHRLDDGSFAPDSLHRLRLIQFARSRGFGDEQLLAAARSQGDLLSVFEEIDDSESDVNLYAASREAGLDGAVITELAEILEWDSDTAGTESDVAALRVVARALELGMPRDALMQLVRIFADAMDRLADAEVRTFHNYVHERFRAQGLAGRELLEATDRVGRPVLDLAESAVTYFHRRAYQRAVREDLLRHLSEASRPPAATPGEELATVLFVDLASFTPLTATMGDLRAAEVLSRMSTMVRSHASRYGGRILKQIGDAFMVMFAQSCDAVRFGLAIGRFVDTEPQFPALHIGAHCGNVLYREGDYVGATVNLASRVAGAGAAGQFLITEELRDALGDIADADFVVLPPRRLKGIPDPVRLVEVRRHHPDGSNREPDPVCGMLLLPDDVASRSTWHGKNFAFCSEICREAFDEDPRRFVAEPDHSSSNRTEHSR